MFRNGHFLTAPVISGERLSAHDFEFCLHCSQGSKEVTGFLSGREVSPGWLGLPPSEIRGYERRGYDEKYA